jgi:hypothetical protein
MGGRTHLGKKINMETREIVKPKVGMVIFTENPWYLFATIKSVVDYENFDFLVHNGYWIGTWKEGNVLIKETNVTVTGIKFVEVFHIEKNEYIGDWLDVESEEIKKLIW